MVMITKKPFRTTVSRQVVDHPVTQDELLDLLYFPGPVTPQEPQNRVRQTYRGLPPYKCIETGGCGPSNVQVREALGVIDALGKLGCMDPSGKTGLGCGCSDRVPADRLGGLMSGSFVGAIGTMLALGRTPSPGAMPDHVIKKLGLGKGGGGQHGGGGHHGGGHHGGGGHHHHGGHGRRRFGRGGGFGPGWGWWGGTDYVEVPACVPGTVYDPVTGTCVCPPGYIFDVVRQVCVPATPPARLRGLSGIALGALGTTASDWCTALRTGSAVAQSFANLCDQITDPTAKAVCQAAFRAAQSGVSTGCAHVDDPSGGTLPPVDLVNQANAFASQMNNVNASTGSAGTLFQPAATADTSKSMTSDTTKTVTYAAIGIGALLAVIVAAKVLL